MNLKFKETPMKIKFIIDPDLDADDYRELYSVEVEMESGESFTRSSNSDCISYEGFRSEIFEDLFLNVAASTGIEVELDEEDYAMSEEELEDLMTASFNPQTLAFEDNVLYLNDDPAGC